MRLLPPLGLALLAAGCASAPKPVPTPVSAPAPRPQSGQLIGLSAAELGARFGRPSFQVKEGPGTKLQWTINGCVLDAYLYPPAGAQGGERVTHVDARRPSGDDLPLATCLLMIAG